MAKVVTILAHENQIVMHNNKVYLKMHVEIDEDGAVEVRYPMRKISDDSTTPFDQLQTLADDEMTDYEAELLAE